MKIILLTAIALMMTGCYVAPAPYAYGYRSPVIVNPAPMPYYGPGVMYEQYHGWGRRW